jgi:hypothetical protein
MSEKDRSSRASRKHINLLQIFTYKLEKVIATKDINRLIKSLDLKKFSSF